MLPTRPDATFIIAAQKKLPPNKQTEPFIPTNKHSRHVSTPTLQPTPPENSDLWPRRSPPPLWWKLVFLRAPPLTIVPRVHPRFQPCEHCRCILLPSTVPCPSHATSPASPLCPNTPSPYRTPHPPWHPGHDRCSTDQPGTRFHLSSGEGYGESISDPKRLIRGQNRYPEEMSACGGTLPTLPTFFPCECAWSHRGSKKRAEARRQKGNCPTRHGECKRKHEKSRHAGPHCKEAAKI